MAMKKATENAKKQQRRKSRGPGSPGAFLLRGGARATTGSLREPRIGIMQRKRSLRLGVLRVAPRGAYDAEYPRLLFD